ncbi:MAG: ABC transporter permease [Candidatus Eisenbacteria bacterium]
MGTRRTVLALVKKEFLQVFRDKMMLRLIFIAPLFQLLLLGYAVNLDVRLIYTAVFDRDRTEISREFLRSFSADDYFVIEAPNIPVTQIEDGFRENRYNAALVIPEDFSERLEAGQEARVGFWVDGTNANAAGIAIGYAGLITQKFNERMTPLERPITLHKKFLYNPEAKTIYFMVPAIVATLLTSITVMLTSMAIVREREMGTLEQVMVTPISTPAFIMGKTIPFAILGFIEITVALAFGIAWFKIPFVGSPLLLYSLAFVYLFTTLGVGMFISTISHTQQQAMFFGWFFSVFTILTSGFFTPVENMPKAVRYITLANPLQYFMKIVRGIIMKGAGISDLYREIGAMLVFGALIFTFSWIRFSKRAK